jgi:hypothetical protein
MIVDLVWKNYEQKEKSDEYEMFLGKSGKNRLEGKDDLLEIYKYYVTTIKPKSQFFDVFTVENLENYMVTSLAYLEGQYGKVMTNLMYLELNGELARFLFFLTQKQPNESLTVLSALYTSLKTPTINSSHLTFIIPTCLFYLSHHLTSSPCPSFIHALNAYTLALKQVNTHSPGFFFAQIPAH